MNALHIARLTVREASRRRILLLIVVGSVLFLALFAAGMGFLLAEVQEGLDQANSQVVSLFAVFLTIMGFYALNFLAGLSAIFTSVNTISGEIDSGTIYAVLARPLRRREIILGKWLGFAIVLALYVIVMSGGLFALVYFFTGVAPTAPVAVVGILVLMTLTLLTLSLLGGTFLPTLANGIGLFLLYGLGWLGGMIESVGNALGNETMVQIGIVVSLVIPSDALWRAASYYLQPPSLLLMQSAPSGPSAIPFVANTPPAPAMLIYVVLYTLAALGLAIAIFNRRDL